nr:Vacuolar protein sorting associated protein 13A [Hymenolepis microstoma]
MVFETLVADLLNRYLGSYLETLSASQLSLGLLSGNVSLENVDVRATAFDDFQIPVRVIQGHIRKLKLKIPFKNLYTEPVIAELEGLYILAVPRAAAVYDENKERQYRREAKRRTLQSIDELRQVQQIQDKEASDTFLEKLASQVIKNVQVVIENIHIRYEDQTTIRGLRFSAGITLSRLAFQTCDAFGQPVILANDSSKEFFKLAELDSFAIYWNHNSALYGNLPTGPLRNVMSSSIASFDRTTTGMDYILRPISFNSLLHIHMQPEKAQFKIPQVGVDIKFEEIEVGLQHNQYVDILLLLDSVDRLILQNKFLRYKSMVDSKEYSKSSISRWMFAYNAVLEEIVRRRTRVWSWQHIKEHRQMINDYTNLWTKKLLNDTLTPQELAKIDSLEDELDVMNLTLARQAAEIQASKTKAARAAKSSSSGKSGGGWFSWLISGSSSSTATTPTDPSDRADVGNRVIQRVQEEMTPEEKQKLYAALNYTEGMGRSSYPPDYVSTIVNFSLGGLTLMLANNELKTPSILKVQLISVTSDFKQRSGDNAMDLSLKLAGFEVFGTRNAFTDVVPTLISSTAIGQSLLSVNFAMNPLDRKADQRAHILAAPIQVVYDADTINKIVDFFKLPEGLQLNEISSSMMPSLDEMKAMTTTGLRYLVSQRSYLDLYINIQSSYFLLPEFGVYTKGCRLIMVNFGSVDIQSIRAQLDLPRTDEPTTEQASLASSTDVHSSKSIVGRAQSDERYKQLMHASHEELLSEAYDQFKVALTATQIILVRKGEDFMQMRSLEDSPGHVLKPLGVGFMLRRCIAPREFDLPQFHVEGRLPLLAVDLTDEVLESLVDIIAHLPLPEANPTQRMPTDPEALLKNVKFFDAQTEDLLPGQLKAMQVLRATNKIAVREPSTSSSDDPVEDSNDIFFDSPETPNSPSSSEPAPQKSETRKPLANLTMVKASFIVDEIRIRLFEAATINSSSDPSTPMLVFTVNQIGADVSLRQWDQEINAYIKRLSLEAPRFFEFGSDIPVCLIDTSTKSSDVSTSDDEHHFSAKFLMADKNGPEFDTKYANTRHSLVCKLRVLKVCLHKEALVSLMGFFNDLTNILSKNLEFEEELKDKDQKALEWATLVGDTEGSAQLREKSMVSTREASLISSKTTPADAISGVFARRNERRDIRIGAAFEAVKLGRYLKIPEIDSTQWKIQATLDNVQILFCSSQTKLMSFSMGGTRADLRMTYLSTEIAVALTDIRISDHNKESLYRQILWIEPGANVFLMQTVLYNRSTTDPELQYDPDKVDVAVSLQFGKAHVIMLYLFLRKVVNFMESFQTAIQYALTKASEVTDAAKNQMEQIAKQSQPPRVALSINFEAPVVYMPQNSTSRTALVFDLGRISLANVFDVLPKSAVLKDGQTDAFMMDRMNIQLKDLRMSAAILNDGGIEVERNVIQPINLMLKLQRKVFPSEGDGIPTFNISGTLESVRLLVTYGDYKLLNDVFFDNFKEADEVLGPLDTGTKINAPETKNELAVPLHVSDSSSVPQDLNSIANTFAQTLDKFVSFNFVLKSLEIELFLGMNDPENWNQQISPSRRLGIFTCTELCLEGDVFANNSSNAVIRLKDISLTDTRPHSENHITNILSQAGGSEGQMKNFVEIYYHSDREQNQTLDVNVCSIMVCASLDYFMILTKFFTEGASYATNSEVDANSYPAKHRASISTRRQSVVSAATPQPPKKNIGSLRIKSNIADPEIILPEDMSNPDCNAIFVTTSLNFDYTILPEETIMNAGITNFRILACPFQRADRGERTMEVLIPTSVYFYGRQPVGAFIHGSITMESLVVNVNAPIIRSISKIMNQLSESATDVTLLPEASIPSARKNTLEEIEDFWAVQPVKSTDIPVTMGQTDYDIHCEEAEGCDAANVVKKVEEERQETIVVRIAYVCLSMESQIGNKQIPMLLMEAHVDGELKSPSTAFGLSLNFELAVSYYNDHLNEWEQLLETLPAENNRLWSLQLEYNSADSMTQGTKPESEGLSDLQSTGTSLTLLSEDSLEITISKTALDVLTKLGKSFEEAYLAPKTVIPHRESIDIKAPYVIRNQTGLPLMIVVDGQRLQDFENPPIKKLLTTLPTRQIPIGLVGHVIKTNENLGLYDVLINKTPTVQNLRSAPKTPPRPIHLGLVPNSATFLNDCNKFADRTASIRIHRTANYIVSAASFNEGEDFQPIVASITAFLGQKTLYLQSTVQVVNETPDAIKIYSLHSHATGKGTFLGTIKGGDSSPLPVEVVTSGAITGVRICPDIEGSLPSSDVIYWPPKACPQTAKRKDRGDACIYLVPRSTAISRNESEWPVQEVVCSVPHNASENQNSVFIDYDYTVTFVPRFSGDQEGPVDFLQPPNSNTLKPVAYNMVIRAPASLHNHLPVPVSFNLTDFAGNVQPGHVAVLPSVKSNGFKLGISFTYNSKDYMTRLFVNAETEELSVIACETHDGYDVSLLNLGLRCSRRPGHIDLTIYCPYWLVNKTGLPLTYKCISTLNLFNQRPRSRFVGRPRRDQKEEEIFHPADFSGVLLFSVTSKSSTLQQKIVMKTEDSLWSSKFSLDTVGNWGRVQCEGIRGRSYEISVKIDLSTSGLTKIITFMPYFMIVNKTSMTLECAQVRDASRGLLDTWLSVEEGDVKPFWPATGDTQRMLMACRINQAFTTDYFPLYESNTVLLKLPKPYIGLYVDVQTTDEATVINLQLYKEGMALVHIINDLGSKRTISFFQKDTNVTHTLKTGEHVYYTWDDATKPRQFFLFAEHQQAKPKQIEITTDSNITFTLGSATVHVVSFLSKLQRTLLLTTDPVVASLAARSGEMESITDRISVVLQSVGISMVANQLRKEICYISIRSSDVIWNKMMRGNRLKPLKPDLSEALENIYSVFLLKTSQGEDFPKLLTLPDSIRPTTTVDMAQMVMLEPDNCSLQRTFEPGIQLHYRASANQMQIHAKIFRIQVDSQRLDATFPVVFAPYPQPNSVILDSGPKPLVEILTVVCKTTNEEVYRFKRVECLIQEMQLQLDQGFLNDMIDFFAGSVVVPDELEGFMADQKLTAGPLVDAPVVKDVLQPGRESIFDYIHISPIKMHVSFSMVGSSDESLPSALQNDVLKLFLQSLGVALTDVQDVVFKLGYFERQGRIMSFSKILAEMSRHYISQAIKQTYVLIFGLDVIGNPFGVIRGMAQGVEDLFYEPVKGAVVGTEEFAEGVKLGVRSLFGHTVGGAAGAMSRITGTLGKGVAALTMDDDFKRRRREQMTRTPENFGAGVARGGKGLVMGVFGGVTGIFTQPISGAKKEGVEGFFKGLGKGLIGTVTRPVSGVVDFASTSFEGIRRAASTSKEVIPARPPRFIHLDGVIRPYDRHEAEGNVIFSRLHGRTPSEEYAFHIPLKKVKGACLLTNERIILVTVYDILGTCTIDWEVPLSQLRGVPHKNDNGFELSLEKASKTNLFRSPTNLKQIDCSPDNALRMLSKIRHLMGESPRIARRGEAPPPKSSNLEVD